MAFVAYCSASLASGISVVVERDWYRVVSSAYVPSPMPGGRMSGQSFTYSRNNVGPRMLPCGTPALMLWGVDDWPPTTALIVIHSVPVHHQPECLYFELSPPLQCYGPVTLARLVSSRPLQYAIHTQ